MSSSCDITSWDLNILQMLSFNVFISAAGVYETKSIESSFTNTNYCSRQHVKTLNVTESGMQHAILGVSCTMDVRSQNSNLTKFLFEQMCAVMQQHGSVVALWPVENHSLKLHTLNQL